MKSPEIEEGNLTEAENSNRRLAYTNSFKKFVSENPRIILIFQKIIKRLRENLREGKVRFNDSFEEEGVKITLIDRGGPHYAPAGSPGSYLKVEFEEHCYFVKLVRGNRELGSGAEELKSLKDARECLKGLKNVEVVDFQLGYEDKQNTYFVSKWEEGTRLDLYLDILDKKSDVCFETDRGESLKLQKQRGELFRRAGEIKGRLISSGFIDIDHHNILYNPKTDKLLVFDVFPESLRKSF